VADRCLRSRTLDSSVFRVVADISAESVGLMLRGLRAKKRHLMLIVV
jgi:hypothetical protein